MRLAPDLTDACERLALCVQPLADAEGQEWIVVRPYREGNVDGYAPVLPWAVPLAEATPLELRHAAGRVVPGFGAGAETPVNMHATPAQPPPPAVTVPAAGPSIRPVTPAPQTPDPGRPRSGGPRHGGGPVKLMLDDLHLRKIDLADEVYVLNRAGYVGPSTAREIAYAHKHGKPVRYLVPPQEGN